MTLYEIVIAPLAAVFVVSVFLIFSGLIMFCYGRIMFNFKVCRLAGLRFMKWSGWFAADIPDFEIEYIESLLDE